MTPTEANALLDAFLTAKAAGQEELWRETHPEAPDGATVLAVWLFTMQSMNYYGLIRAIYAVDTRCALRMAIYAAIVAHPVWDRYCGALDEAFHSAPGEAIRAAIACYHDPTEVNCQFARGASAHAEDAAAHLRTDLLRAAEAAARAAHAACAASAAARAASYAPANAIAAAAAVFNNASYAADAAADAYSDDDVISTIIAAIADHYEGRPLEMP